jgi:hypothetical protein
LDCGGKRSATPLWIFDAKMLKKSKAPPLSAHSKFVAQTFNKTFSAAC